MTLTRFTTRHLGVLAASALLAGATATAVRAAEMELSMGRANSAVIYPEGSTLTLKFTPTFRIPNARAEAKIERKKGITEIEIELDEMKPASAFGSNYNTYVLWVISPEGQVESLGAFTLQGTKSKLDVTTKLGAFGAFITAEPHSMVRVPSRIGVLINSVPDNPSFKSSAVTYQGRVGVYPLERESLADVPAAVGELRTEVGQAKAAVGLAEEAQAAKWAPEKLTAAKAALGTAEAAANDGKTKPTEVSELGRTAIRTAVAARDAAIKAAVKDAAAEAARIKAEYEGLKVKFEKVAATLKLAAVKDSERGLTVDLPDALFDSGKATLKPEAREVVSRIASIMLGAGAVRLKIEGHTDNQGKPDMNLSLSKDRANAIKEYLVDASIPAAWIATDGFGETKPIADNETPEGRQKNRRVEIVIGRVQG